MIGAILFCVPMRLRSFRDPAIREIIAGRTTAIPQLRDRASNARGEVVRFSRVRAVTRFGLLVDAQRGYK